MTTELRPSVDEKNFQPTYNIFLPAAFTQVYMKKDLESNEAELLTRCQHGESAAFGELIGRYRQPLFAYLLRLCGDPSNAEDLFQDTLIKAWQNLRRYDHRNRFGSWLFGIAHNVAVDGFRQQKARSMIFYAAELPELPNHSDPTGDLLQQELHDAVMRALQELPEKQRQVFLLRQHGSLSFKEISEVMREPVNTVLSHMHYAVKKLKVALRENHAS